MALLLTGRFAGGSPSPDASPPPDLDVKATFVLNFVRLVAWRDLPGEQDARTLPVCALSRSEYFTAVRNVAGGKRVGSRSVTVTIDPDPDPLRCRVLIVDAPQYASSRRVLSGLKNLPVLTVGNGAGFLDCGGMFELTVRERNVQFDASLYAIRRAGLDVSARLLRLARSLRKGDPGVF